MTLIGVKASTKDVDFMLPVENEYSYLIKTLKSLGYKEVGVSKWKRKGEIWEFDLYKNNNIFTTELLESPMEGNNHIKLESIGSIYVGILNYYDLIISKLMRGSGVDFDDCRMLIKAKPKEIDINTLKKRWNETIKYDISEERIRGHLDFLLARI
ncbi:MAG: hypothetical protein P9X22_07370 [Candidatus Zapsychrus exili]|nr:hypothetical protein [Candidatus Zapsychrus exili]